MESLLDSATEAVAIVEGKDEQFALESVLGSGYLPVLIIPALREVSPNFNNIRAHSFLSFRRSLILFHTSKTGDKPKLADVEYSVIHVSFDENALA